MTKEQSEKSVKPAMSRAQRRQVERIEEECQRVYQSLSNNFLSFLVTSDNPTDDSLNEKAKQIDAQWRVFAKAKNLNIKIFGLAGKYCTDLIEEYKKSKLDDTGRDQGAA